MVCNSNSNEQKWSCRYLELTKYSFLLIFLWNFSLICKSKPREVITPKWYEKPYEWNQVRV